MIRARENGSHDCYPWPGGFPGLRKSLWSYPNSPRSRGIIGQCPGGTNHVPSPSWPVGLRRCVPRGPRGRGRIRGGAAVRVITPDPLLPVSGGMGGTSPTQREAGRADGPGDGLPQGRRLRRRRGARPARVPVGAGRPGAREGGPHPGGEHPHRLDPHPQRPRLLRLPRRQGRAHRRPRGTWTPSATRPRRRSTRRSTASSRPGSRSRPARPGGRSPTTTTPPTSTTGG